MSLGFPKKKTETKAKVKQIRNSPKGCIHNEIKLT